MSDFKDKSRKLARQKYWNENDRDSYECPDCRRSEDEIIGTFEVHHKNGEPLDNTPDNHVALCRVCHMLREDKKPSKKHIDNLRKQVSNGSEGGVSSTEASGVYLAGSMAEERSGEWQTWRASIAEPRSNGVYEYTGGVDVEINSPTEVQYSHGSGNVWGIASDDLELLNSSEAIVAYFDKAEQVGTLTELVYAVSRGMPALVLFDSKVTSGFTDDAAPWDNIQAGVEFQHQSTVYWFLINFLSESGWGGLEADVEMHVVEGRDEIKESFERWAWHDDNSKENRLNSEEECALCGGEREANAHLKHSDGTKTPVCRRCGLTSAGNADVDSVSERIS